MRMPRRPKADKAQRARPQPAPGTPPPLAELVGAPPPIFLVRDANRGRSAGSLANLASSPTAATEDPATNILDPKTAEELRNFLPPLQRESRIWNLAYSIAHDGISINTLFSKAAEKAGGPCSPVLLAIRDCSGIVFGALMSEPPAHHRGYYGNGSCFLWRRNPDRNSISAYLATGENEYYMLSENGADLAFGGGDGKFGLWIDNQLFKGYSSPCQTYSNESLSGSESFEVQALEIWTFQI